MLDDWRRLMERHRCHSGLGLKLYISYLSKSILRSVTDAPPRLAMLGDESRARCAWRCDDASANTRGGETRYLDCCFLSSGARVAEL